MTTNNYPLGQRLLAYIILSALFLQSCNNTSNPFIPRNQATKGDNAETQPVEMQNIEPVAKEGHTVTMGEKSQLTATATSLQKEAEQGDVVAQCSLWRYANSNGVEKDAKKVVEWWEKAANQGYAKAQCMLGWMYANGNGVAKNNKQAVQWFEKAANQGDADAQFNLGVMYERGDGVAQDDKKAVECYQKAVNQGHPQAKERLDNLKASRWSDHLSFSPLFKW